MQYDTLIPAENLARHYLEPGWVVVDCRYDLADPAVGRRAYLAGHIPRARFADLNQDLSGGKDGPGGEFRGRHPLPAPETFIETLRKWGVNDDTQVVAYDAHGGMFAARLWWMLRWVGHQSAAVLDGGLQAWEAAGLPLSSEVPEPAPEGNASLRPAATSVVEARQVLANLSDGRYTLIDARAPDRFRGENETLDPVGGHIPGARNRFYKNNLQTDGRFKPAAQLRAEFERIVPDPRATIMQCGSGVSACHNLLAMHWAGLPGAALYPGSWSEWCADRSRPVARGSES